jgi:DNA-binding protein HU-beta
MTKAELSQQISDLTILLPTRTLPASAVKSVIDLALNIMQDEIAKGGTVTLRGFGSFEPVARAAKPGRNISTGQQVVVPAQTVPKFKPCKEFVQRVKDAHSAR